MQTIFDITLARCAIVEQEAAALFAKDAQFYARSSGLLVNYSEAAKAAQAHAAACAKAAMERLALLQS